MSSKTDDSIVAHFNMLKEYKRLSHAYIFYGSDHSTRIATVRTIAKNLGCTVPFCGECAYCIQVDKGTNPDVLEAGMEQALNVEQMRELIRRINVKKFNAPYKIIIIDNVELINVNALDAFLKTLEEPPVETIFLLLTSNLNSVPVTVRSRTQKMRLCPDAYGDGLDRSLYERIIPDSGSFSVEGKDREQFKKEANAVFVFLRDCVACKCGMDISGYDTVSGGYVSGVASQMDMITLLNAAESVSRIVERADNINIGLAKELVDNII